MGKNSAETAMGAVVLLIAFTLLYFFITTVEVGTVQGYDVKAKFTEVDGLRPGSDVRINGINVGTVTQRILAPETYGAIVTLTIKSGRQGARGHGGNHRRRGAVRRQVRAAQARKIKKEPGRRRHG